MSGPRADNPGSGLVNDLYRTDARDLHQRRLETSAWVANSRSVAQTGADLRFSGSERSPLKQWCKQPVFGEDGRGLTLFRVGKAPLSL